MKKLSQQEQSSFSVIIPNPLKIFSPFNPEEFKTYIMSGVNEEEEFINQIREVNVNTKINFPKFLQKEKVKQLLIENIPLEFNVFKESGYLIFRKRNINPEYNRWLHVVNVTVNDPVQFVNDFMNIDGKVCFSQTEDFFYTTRKNFFAIVVEGYSTAVFDDDVWSDQDFIGRRVQGRREGSNRTEAWVIPASVKLDVVVTDIESYVERLERAGIPVALVSGKETLMTQKHPKKEKPEEDPNAEYEEYEREFDPHYAKTAQAQPLFPDLAALVENLDRAVQFLEAQGQTRTDVDLTPEILAKVVPDSPSIRISSNGNIKFYNEKGRIHRDDGPAIEYADGSKEWYKDGRFHREDGPARELADGTKEWYKNDKLHREDGPAYEWADGSKEWYKNGLRHRDNGPAVELASGIKAWYKNGLLHREDGPAIKGVDGYKEWYLNGKSYKEEDYWKELKHYKQHKELNLMQVGNSMGHVNKKAQIGYNHTISQQDLEDIYELTYKYQMLKREEQLGDYGIPASLPDKAYIEKEKIKHTLDDLLNETYGSILYVYDDWIQLHEPNPADSSFKDDIWEWWKEIKEEQDIDRLKEICNEDSLQEDLLIILDEHGIGQEEEILEQDPYEEKIKYLNTIKSKKAQQEQFPFIETLPLTQKPKDVDINTLSFDELVKLDIVNEDILEELFNNIEKTTAWDSWAEEQVEDSIKSYYEDTAIGSVIEVKDEIEQGWGQDLDENIRLFQIALTTAHNNGDMAEYLVAGPDPVAFLHRLSAGPKVEEWNRDLSKVLGYEVGSRIAPKQEWFTSAMKKAIAMLKNAMKKTAVIRKCKKGDEESGKPWCLYTKDESRLLGRHPTKESAEKQMRLVEMKKHGRLQRVIRYLEIMNE